MVNFGIFLKTNGSFWQQMVTNDSNGNKWQQMATSGNK